ncbi:MAG: hypothetical protein ACTSQI_01810 [Candidatus Helarchaeota archaeon]
MAFSLSEMVNQKKELISGISEKFHISMDGAREFLELAIIDWVKTNYKIDFSENNLPGDPQIIKKLKEEILSWTADDFDEEDFQVIGYCKNIR